MQQIAFQKYVNILILPLDNGSNIVDDSDAMMITVVHASHAPTLAYGRGCGANNEVV